MKPAEQAIHLIPYNEKKIITRNQDTEKIYFSKITGKKNTIGLI